MSSFFITPFDETAHRAGVVSLWRSVFGYEAAHNDPAIAIAKKLAVADALFWVALSEATVVGSIMAGYDGHRGWLYSLAVLPSHRQRKIGTVLVREAERALSDLGCMKINLQIMPDNESVQGFYTSQGYCSEERINMGKCLPENIPNFNPNPAGSR